MTGPKVIAVYGALRSGTTLLRLMMNGHSQLHCPGETDFLLDHLHQNSQGTWHFDRQSLEDDRIYRNHRALVTFTNTHTKKPADLFRLEGPAGQTIVLMMHRHIDLLLDVFPGIPIIHLLRDPRDVARSSIGMGWAGNVYRGVEHWIGTETRWQAAVPAMADGQVMRMQYEALIRAPEVELSRLCDFIGLPYEDKMLSYDESSTYSRPDPALTEQWRRKQTPREIGLVEGRVGALLQGAGYAPSGHPAVHPGPVERVQLDLSSRLAGWRWRVRNFGLRDPLTVAIAGRIGLPALGRKAQRRIDEKVIRLLK